jgi:IS30 family transposase
MCRQHQRGGHPGGRKSRYVVLAKLDGSDATAVLEGFTRRMRTLPTGISQTLAYDQGKEMAGHPIVG